MSQWGPGNCLQPQDWEVEMNLFSRVHNWELSLWPLWSQKHPSDWPEKINHQLLFCEKRRPTDVYGNNFYSKVFAWQPKFACWTTFSHRTFLNWSRIFWSTPNATKATTRCTTTSSSYISWQPWTIGKFYSPNKILIFPWHKKCFKSFFAFLTWRNVENWQNA